MSQEAGLIQLMVAGNCLLRAWNRNFLTSSVSSFKKREIILTLPASLCFLIHFFPAPFTCLLFSSESMPFFVLLCDTGVGSKLCSFVIWQMLSFVSRGHWKATAGRKGPLPGFSVLFSFLFLWLLATSSIWDTQWCSLSRECSQRSSGQLPSESQRHPGRWLPVFQPRLVSPQRTSPRVSPSHTLSNKVWVLALGLRVGALPN